MPRGSSTVPRRIAEEIKLCEGCTGNCQRPDRDYLYLRPVIVAGRVAYTTCEHRPILSRASLAQIPRKYADKTFDDYRVTADNRKAVSIAKWMVNEKPSTGAYFYGDVGTGKTFLASLIAQAFVRDGHSVIFGDVPRLLADIKATFDNGGTDKVLKRYCTCDLLILDDMGAEQVTDWSTTQVYLIVNARYNANLPTVTTSNYDFDGLVERYKRDAVIARRIVSRLKETTAQAFFGTQDRRNLTC